MTSALRLVAIASATLFAGASQATTTFHTDTSTFLDALIGGAYTESFNGLDPLVEPSVFSGLGFSYELSAPGGLYASGRDVGTNLPEKTLTITFTGRPVSAVGGNFFGTDINPDFLPETLLISLSDGTAVTWSPVAKSNFLGFTSTVAITSMTLEFADFYIGRYVTVDNLTVGVSPVPEPGQWALLAMGLGALSLLKRRSAV